MKILIAEDDAISAQILASTLTGWGYEAVMAQDGQEAWQKLQEAEPPRLAILDWMMPELSGLEICQQLRSQSQQPYTYVLLLTGKAEKEDVIRGLTAGADDYITKPFDPQELKVRIDSGIRILRLEEALRSTLNKLRESEAQRSQFISALTHDLRTPLVAERRALELMQHYHAENASQSNLLLQSLQKNNQDLLTLVNQLLESYQSEEAMSHIHPTLFSIHSLISECFLSVTALAKSQHIQLINSIAPNFPSIWGDATQLKRVFTNLLGNALAHSPEGAWISVTASDQGDMAKIQIQDSGAGIHPDMLPHVFERYYAGANRSLKIGAGLGLSICKAIVEQHQGTISVESTLGQGSCFSLTLPKAELIAPNHSKELLRVLLVDDQKVDRISLNLALEATGHVEVLAFADNAEEALTVIETQKPDLMIMDLMTPELTGSHVARQIKAQHPELKILVCTAQAHPRYLQIALAAGVDGYCLKETNPQQLVKIMQRVHSGIKWVDSTLTGTLESPLSQTANIPIET